MGGDTLGQNLLNFLQETVLATFAEEFLEGRVGVKMVENGLFTRAYNKDEGIYTRIYGLSHGVLDERPVDNGQQFLGYGLGGGQKPGA
jgi:hypothetical protein